MVLHERFFYLVSTRRDPVPGWNHEPEDMRLAIEKALPEHYKPHAVFVDRVTEASDQVPIVALTEDLWEAYKAGCLDLDAEENNARKNFEAWHRKRFGFWTFPQEETNE